MPRRASVTAAFLSQKIADLAPQDWGATTPAET